MKKSQAAIEFLMTYGWAILAVLLAIMAFSYFKPFFYCPPSYSFSDPGISVVGQKFIGSDVSYNPAKNLFYIVFKNSFSNPITITGVSIEKGGKVCGSVLIPGVSLNEGEKTNTILGRLTNPDCQGVSNRCYSYDVKIKYKDQTSSLETVAHGTMGGKFESEADSLWSVGGPWTTYGVGGNVITIQNRNGQKINYCANEAPPNPAMLTATIPSSTIYWDLPSGCDTSGIAQVGFASATCNNRAQLAKTWLHNTFYLDNIFSAYKLYLGGTATYYDTVAGKTVTDGICLNDNLYIYVNSALKYYGGTTGKMTGGESTYEAGDEVIKGCGNCADVDASAWCIPPLELTTSGFSFGINNSVDILVEDFCKSSTHAGGMSALNIQLI